VCSLSSGGITDRSANPTHLGAEGTSVFAKPVPAAVGIMLSQRQHTSTARYGWHYGIMANQRAQNGSYSKRPWPANSTLPTPTLKQGGLTGRRRSCHSNASISFHSSRR